MKPKSAPKQSKFAKYIHVPLRVLARARDFYMKSLTGFGGPVPYGNLMGNPTPHLSTVNSNYITTDDELKDLIRLTTDRRLTGKFEAAGFHRPKSVVPIGGGMASAPRGNTAVFGRIDEDREC
ncbi:hypothetical protein CASFOL_037111 [Castilleja foliolosa]|uniref:Uncharacterized protein n=1 Tax=Castilleja foliolosa TaxID=1961234 RepID=A0ABD3BN05_9LAMI